MGKVPDSLGPGLGFRERNRKRVCSVTPQVR
jgi:hypothetical protein